MAGYRGDFGWDIPGVPEKFDGNMFVFNSSSLFWEGDENHEIKEFQLSQSGGSLNGPESIH